jgi:hypothetical protein
MNTQEQSYLILSLILSEKNAISLKIYLPDLRALASAVGQK